MKKGIGLLSGGLDSSVSIAFAIKKGVKIIVALTFDYGQKAAGQEIKVSRRLCRYWKIPHQVIHLWWLKRIAGGSSLINRQKNLPHLELSDLGRREILQRSARSVWIPNRNGIFINIAVAFAEVLKADYIITGFNDEEARTFPDNSPEFIRAINQSLKWGSIQPIKVVSYTIKMDKDKIVRTAERLGISPDMTWSCYEGGKRPCGKCESCLRRQRYVSLD